jgi:hypothetical protein
MYYSKAHGIGLDSLRIVFRRSRNEARLRLHVNHVPTRYGALQCHVEVSKISAQVLEIVTGQHHGAGAYIIHNDADIVPSKCPENIPQSF